MKNQVLFDQANATNDAALKAYLRDTFLSWCQANGRTPQNPVSIQDWWALESEDRI